MTRFIYALVAVAAFGAFVNAQNCNLESCQGRPHTLCLYPSPEPAKQCNAVTKNFLDEGEKNEILETHNRYRSLVANGQELRGNPGPQPAGKIGSLTWDNELANIAQVWANQCSFGHDQCRDVARFPVGQNVGISSNTGGFTEKYGELVQMWYDEVKDYNRNQVSKFEPQAKPQIGHYTQFVWGSTTTVGCGAVRYKDGESYKTYLVCNYGPTGNWIGEPVYQTV